ncbi:MAG: hypothetical protein IT488_08465 [Gammaproteobacteria bacterium]|nr:hypothetical protein [Gammaproteobacteria bacterium]
MNAARMLLLTASLWGATAVAQETAQIIMPGISVIGDQELPKVLYIVPWKEAASLGAMEPPVPIPGDDAFAVLNRDEFLRKLRYQRYVNAPVDSTKR